MFGKEHVQIVHVFAWGTVTSIMYFGWLLLLIHGDGDGWIHRALSAPIFRRIATLGYGVYLVHIPLCDHVDRARPRARSQARHVPMVHRVAGRARVAVLASLAGPRVRDARLHREAVAAPPRAPRWLAAPRNEGASPLQPTRGSAA